MEPIGLYQHGDVTPSDLEVCENCIDMIHQKEGDL